jgi:formylglycine-generating enzyme required for sulfatase activity
VIQVEVQNSTTNKLAYSVDVCSALSYLECSWTFPVHLKRIPFMKSQSTLLSLVAAVTVTFGLSTSSVQAQCAADVNHDGLVDAVDLAQTLSTWGTKGGSVESDINGDGSVDGIDLAIVLSAWGVCPNPTWGTVLEWTPDPAVVTDANLRAAIVASGFAWRVRDNGTNIEMLLVPRGIFTMGCSPGDTECLGDESPAHQVTFTNAFYMGRTEVTQAQWTATMGSNPSGFGGQPNNPVDQVSWNMIQGFNSATGLRLPTEAEWEFACRAGTTTARYGAVNDIAWYNGNAGGTTHAVAGKLPNALGLYDTLGNVWEWCQDWYGPYASGSETNPTGPGKGSDRLLRGGCWYGNSNHCRGSQRFTFTPSSAFDNFGFRAVRNP